jgi:pilus assembly protein Flp/PilA
MTKFIAAAKSFVKDQEGATMVEYGLMIALIAAVCVGVITTLGTNLKTLFTNVGNSV